MLSKLIFLTEVPVHKERFAQLAAMSSRFMTSTYAWAYPTSQILKELEELGTAEIPLKMWFASSAYVSAEKVGWVPRLLGQMAIMQPINAQIQAKTAPELLDGGCPDTSRPSIVSGLRPDNLSRLVEARPRPH